MPDEQIPGTLNVGHTLPTIAQAFIFIAIVTVDMATLAMPDRGLGRGAWLGAGVVAGVAAAARSDRDGDRAPCGGVVLRHDEPRLFPAGGDTVGLTAPLLWFGIAGNFVLGALMTLGIGLYAPCMILVALLGMNPRAAFPIMMGSCAFLMPVGSLRFIQKDSYALKAAMGLTLGGIPAVFLAAFFVKSLPLTLLRWLVVAVVIYAAVAMLRSARAGARAGTGPTPAAMP